MRNEAKCISTATLLNERYRRDLYNKMTIRPMANDNDVIWQQMPLEYFASLLVGKQLFLRAYGEYVSYDEKRLIEFVKPHVAPIDDECKRSVIQSEMEKEYSEFEKKLFISCWFNSKNLSDVVFKVYAKGNSGIAIGTTVGILKEQLDNVLTKDAGIQNIVCGNVQYIPQTLLSTEQMFEPAQIYAPIFLKGVQFQMDTEFRVCVELKEPQELIYNKREKRQIQSRRLSASADQLKSMVSTSKEDCKISAELFQQMEQYLSEYDGKLLTAGCAKQLLGIEPSQLIQNIAVKEDGIWKKFSDAEIESFFYNVFKMRIKRETKAEYVGSGFMIFNVEKIEEDWYV